MFTGIVQGLGQVTAIADRGGIRRLTVQLPEGRGQSLEIGASVAINGVCLTVVAFDADRVSFDVIDETLRLTNLGGLSEGSFVNTERAARFGDEIGGHVLSGHIHALAEVVRVEPLDANLAVWWRAPDSLQKYLMPKGYVALNGCSLTLGDTPSNGLWSIHLIPETRRLTTFGTTEPGDWLNLEIDSQTQAIVDTIERVLEHRQ